MASNEWFLLECFYSWLPFFQLVRFSSPRLIAPRKPNPIKLQTYECGIETVGET